jgi:hypothetical protein
LTKPGGHIVISEVNALNPFLQFQLFLARGLNMYFTHVDEDGKEILIGRERIITAYGLKQIFARRRVRCKSIRYFRIFPNHPVFNGLGRVEKLLARNWLAPLADPFQLRRPTRKVVYHVHCTILQTLYSSSVTWPFNSAVAHSAMPVVLNSLIVILQVL